MLEPAEIGLRLAILFQPSRVEEIFATHPTR